MKQLLTILLCLLVSSCGVLGPSVEKNFSANTTASVNLDKGFNYSSNKNQEMLKASGSLEAGKLSFSVETTATTPEAAIGAAAAAMAQATAVLGQVVQAIIPLVQSAVQGAAASQGIPLPKPATP